MSKKIILWTAAVIITFLTAFLHQRLSPHYPVSGSFGIEGERVTYLFNKIHYGKEPFRVLIRTDKEGVSGVIRWRSKTGAEWKDSPLERNGRFLETDIESRDPGTKIEYKGIVRFHDESYVIPPGKTVTVSFAGKRPASVMNVFYFFLFGGLLISVRGALDYFNPQDKRVLFSFLAATFFFASSVIFYPFLKSYELGVINKSIPPIEELFDLPLILLFLLWFAGAIVIFKYKTKMILLISGVLTVIIYQFISFY